MSNRRRGARTGLKKPREIEAHLSAEQWRANGGALQSGADRDAVNAAFERRVMTAISGQEPGEPKRVNHLVQMLLMAAGALDDAVLAAAAHRLEELGLGGDDYEAKIEALTPHLPDVALATLLLDMTNKGASERSASERLATDFAVPALSHAAAAKRVRRARERSGG